MSKTVLVFGTFDGLHAGHRFFLQEAAKLADELVVGVARDRHVRNLKGESPQQDEQQRLAAVAALSEVSRALLCDEELGSYHILKTVKPDVVACGHDQDDLRRDLEARGVSVVLVTKLWRAL